jgi:hypothetical protein
MLRTTKIAVSLALLLWSAPAWADGSIDFNALTSKAEHTTADVLSSATAVHVLFWIYPDGQGEGSAGRIVVLDEGEGNATLFISHNNANNQLFIRKNPGAAGTAGQWTVPVTDGQFNAVAIALDYSGDNNPTARVNFASAVVTTTVAPVGIQDVPATGYSVGNNSAQTRTWDGKIAYVQVLNAVLSDADADKALRSPGSVTSNLRLYIRGLTSTDITDLSGNSFDATGTDLATGADGPGVYFLKKLLSNQ